MRVPIDQTFAAINQAFLIHLNENFDDGVMEIAILIRGGIGGARHGECGAVPITAGAKAF